MKKYYVVDGIVNGDELKERKFKSRKAAEKCLERLLYDNDLQVDTIINRSKHGNEYICSSYTRFFVNRVVVR